MSNNPIKSLEYLGDASDQVRDAAATLRALQRFHPDLYARVQATALALIEIARDLNAIRGTEHANLFSDHRPQHVPDNQCRRSA